MLLTNICAYKAIKIIKTTPRKIFARDYTTCDPRATGKMTSVVEPEDSILLKESVIRGHHVFKNIWTPRLGEILACA